MDTRPDDALTHNAQTGLWEVGDPALVRALLQDGRLGVRPPAQPLPPHLQGRLLGQLFARWLRQRDDEGHAAGKRSLVEALDRLPIAAARAAARSQAAIAFAAGWNHALWALPLAGMASLLGLAPANLAAQRRLLEQLRALAQGLAPAATPAGLDAADAACAALLQALGPAPSLGLPAEDEPANRLALLWQSFEAGAALLGRGLVALAEDAGRRRPGHVAAWLPGLQDTPGVVLNTRRYAREPLAIGALRLNTGDGLLLRLAGSEGAALGFGAGPHRCPGRSLALAIAAEALEWLLERQPPRWPTRWQYLTLPNARIAIFDEESFA
ncbi:hypothetical protein [Roseateles violae]|uniref:Cytochrome P450 n=1 Tax=Roseateles violae TaxID=3058042 RepID=A0ABT8DYL9_9BURK|nr:hypothetical protein [Pelomonas sp. PFR6]MDN3922677.1 hypothetical protein [Pelomonas sp. PFR6]